MQNYVIGIKANGERITFERWVYDGFRNGCLFDAYLLAACVEIVEWRI